MRERERERENKKEKRIERTSRQGWQKEKNNGIKKQSEHKDF
jgi:hypothetical protein